MPAAWVNLPLAAPLQRGNDSAFGNVDVGLGVGRRRRLRTTTRDSGVVQWRLTPQQTAVWRDWYEDTLLAGALDFYMPWQSFSEDGLERVVVRFAEPPQIEVRAGFVLITATVVRGVISNGLIPEPPPPQTTIVWVRSGSSVGSAPWVATARTNWFFHTVAYGTWQLAAVPNVVLGAVTITTDTPNFRQWTQAYTSNGTAGSPANLSSVRLFFNGTSWEEP